MSTTPTSFLDLPPEIRCVIYSFVFKQRIDGWVRRRVDEGSAKWPQVHSPELHYTKKPKAILQPSTNTSTSYTITTNLPISQLNRGLRLEVLNHLAYTHNTTTATTTTADANSGIDVSARILNFDFTHLIAYLCTCPAPRQRDFHVREDGTAASWLTLELCGPYDHSWRANLHHWLEFVQRLVGGGRERELATRHRIGVDTLTTSMEQADDGSAAVVGRGSRERVSSAFMIRLYYNYQEHTPGAARLELDKIFYSVYAKYWVESQWDRDGILFGW